jgi:hypothetical protein
LEGLSTDAIFGQVPRIPTLSSIFLIAGPPSLFALLRLAFLAPPNEILFDRY